MKKNKSKKIPYFKSLDALVNFFDSNDMSEYFKSLPETKFEVNLRRKLSFFSLDNKIADKLTKISKIKQIPSEVLINTWLKTKIQEQI